MQVTQLHTLINAVTQEVLGETAVVNEDLSNIVDIGNQVFNASAVDNYVKSLVNHIGKVIFSNRLYSGGVPSVLMDSWEYGSVLQKITSELPTATENDSWNLTDGTDYSPDVFYQPTISAKFFNSRVTFEIPMSFTERQVKESFSNAEQLNGFISMLTTSVENSMTVKLDSLIMRTINNMIGQTAWAELEALGVIDPSLTGVKAVNLLDAYNAIADTPITVADALTDRDFIRFATYTIGLYSDRMARVSTLFNVEGKEKFTPYDQQITVLLSDFSKASETFLKSETFNDEKVTLPKHDSVPYWQGSGLAYDFDSVSSIDVIVKDGETTATVQLSGILGVMFDREALGVTNLNRRVTTNYNPKAEFYTNFYKFDAGYFNDLGENFVLFFIGA